MCDLILHYVSWQPNISPSVSWEYNSPSLCCAILPSSVFVTQLSLRKEWIWMTWCCSCLLKERKLVLAHLWTVSLWMYVNLPDSVPFLFSLLLLSHHLNETFLFCSSYSVDFTQGPEGLVFISFYVREDNSSRKAFFSLNIRLLL